MKRFLQIVALVVAALLAAQPALANQSCSLLGCSGGHSAMSCCRHADGMQMSGEATGPRGASCAIQQRDALAAAACASGRCPVLARPADAYLAASAHAFGGNAGLARPRDVSIQLQGPRSPPAAAAAAPAPRDHTLFRALRI